MWIKALSGLKCGYNQFHAQIQVFFPLLLSSSTPIFYTQFIYIVGSNLGHKHHGKHSNFVQFSTYKWFDYKSIIILIVSDFGSSYVIYRVIIWVNREYHLLMWIITTNFKAVKAEGNCGIVNGRKDSRYGESQPANRSRIFGKISHAFSLS